MTEIALYRNGVYPRERRVDDDKDDGRKRLCKATEDLERAADGLTRAALGAGEHDGG